MALIVETGAVIANANSYVSLVEADAYFEVDMAFTAAWTALEDDVKEAYLMWATRVLDQKVTWKGCKTVETSSLRWPRTGVYDRDGIVVQDNVMPLQLKQGTFELAKLLTVTDVTTSQGADYFHRLKVDVIEIEYQMGAGQATTPPMLNQILRGLGFYPMALGHSFGRIVTV